MQPTCYRSLQEYSAMEGGWLIPCFTALSTLLLALCFLNFSSGSKGRVKLPPGPWTLPIIGSLHHVASKLPYRRMRELSRRYGPVMHLKLGEVPAVFVSSAEAAEVVFRSKDLAFMSRPRSATLDIFGGNGQGMAFAPYGDHWRQMRKISVVELLSSKQVRRMEGIKADEVAILLRSIAAASDRVNISRLVAALSNNAVTRAAFSGRFTRQDEYLRELDKAFVLVGGSSLVDLFPSSRIVRWLSRGKSQMRTCYDRIQRIIFDSIDERNATADTTDGGGADGEDLLDALLRLQREGSLEFPLTTEMIGALLFDIFGGGTDTSSSTLAWAMAELVSNPQVMAKAQREVREVLGDHRTLLTNNDLAGLHYMGMVIKEVLRLHPPAPFVLRSTREDCQIMGYDILKGTDIFVNVFAISRDPKNWENPEKFMPERFESNNIEYKGTHFEFTPFGAGRRQCPGMIFAASTLDIAMANLLYHFDWKLPDGASLDSFDMSEKFGLTLSRKNDLELKAIPYALSNFTTSK